MRTLEWEGDWPAGGRVSERARDAAREALDSEAAPSGSSLGLCPAATQGCVGRLALVRLLSLPDLLRQE